MQARLSSLVDIVGGGTPDRSNPRYWGGGVPWVTVKDVRGPRIRQTEESITAEGLRNSAANMVAAGSIVLPTRMSLGKVAICEIDCAINQDMKALFIKSSRVEKGYLYRFLESRAQYFRSMGKGATVKGITLDVLEELEVPLPKMDEQIRISRIFEKLDSISSEKTSAVIELSRLIEAMFLSEFGDPTNPQSTWRITTLGEAAPNRGDIVDGPFGSSLKPEHYISNGIRVIRNYNISKGSFDASEFKYVSVEKFLEIRRSEVRSGDVLLSTKGTVGSVCVMADLPGESVLSASGTVRIRLVGGILPQFLVYQMLTPQYQEYISENKAGAVQQYLNLQTIKSLKIIVPPLDVQQKHVEKCRLVESIRSGLKMELEELSVLKRSLLSKYFPEKACA